MNSFGARATLSVGSQMYDIFGLGALRARGVELERLPFCLRILLENLLRTEDGMTVAEGDVMALANWDPKAEPVKEIAFTPARVLLQDFTGVPCVVDLASMRDAMANFGGDPDRINPLQPVELVIDHSVQVDAFGSDEAIRINRDLEYERNMERYEFLRWGQEAFSNFRVVPPNTGIVHQVNLEYLARVTMVSGGVAYPDTLVGTDSHTTMINGLGVLGWGVGGIEAEAAMLGQPVSMLIPHVVGFRLGGRLREGVTATDLVLTVTEMLRKHGVVGKFVEFFGPGLATLPLADRATIANMGPEYGATCGIFPVDEETLRYLRASGRPEEQVALVEAYYRAQGMFHGPDTPDAEYSSVLSLELGDVEPSVAGPRRPQDRAALGKARETFFGAFPDAKPAPNGKVTHGSVVIAAITSCTNTSNPYVMVAAGLVARKAAQRGLRPREWVKTSLAPGSKVVTDYLRRAGLLEDLERIGFHVVGYGCTTCIGNSGPLPDDVSAAIQEGDLAVVSVLSGNRNFEGRINVEVKANYLMSPPLVVAYALAGTIDIDLTADPVGHGGDGAPAYLRDIWPSQDEVAATVESCIHSEMFRRTYADLFEGDEKWRSIRVSGGERFDWRHGSTYVKRAPYFDGMPREAPAEVTDFDGLRVLAFLGDSITTDHISPAGAIRASQPAGAYLIERGVRPFEFNSYGSRRGNHEVMVRGTFANVRLRNRLAPGTEGGFTTHLPSGEVTTIFEASERYREEGAPLMILAGKEYGSGSSRDWAAKGPCLLGVRVVLAESFERIHRSNLVGMGILPLQFLPGEGASTYGLTGRETFAVRGVREGIATGFASGRELEVAAARDGGGGVAFRAVCRIDTPKEREYYRHGGILPYVLRHLLEG
jgi:aconitate hydratase